MKLALCGCTCDPLLRVIRITEGHYLFGANEKGAFIRVLRSRVMVRIGGGWDTLDAFLNKIDPCRSILRKTSKS